MIVTIAPGGNSFKGAFLYYAHDKDALTCERREWTHTENLATDDLELAWRIMAYTALHADTLKEKAGIKPGGRKLEKPVFPFCVAWHPDEKPDMAHKLETAKSAVAALGL